MTPKVLLVDDVLMFLDLQKMFLKLSSVQVLTAKDGAEALQVVKYELPALIFMDLHMPNMDGAECCARIKADQALRSIPVVMITSEGKEEDRARCFRAGCDDFLTKPIDRNLYLDKARKFLPAIDRRDTRVPCRVKGKFKVFGLTLAGEILDVSALGVYMATDYEVETGTVLELVFATPTGTGAPVQAKGRVAWLNSKKEKKKAALPTGFGVEFVALTEESKNSLKLFVEMQK
jgi:CheY-like chemotaxis protein